MQANTVETTDHKNPSSKLPDTELTGANPNPYSGYRVIRRNGKTTGFDPEKIKVAITKTFLDVEGGCAAASSRMHEIVDSLTGQVCRAVTRHLDTDSAVHIESIQDQVELALMRSGEHKVARAYVLYREEHAKARAKHQPDTQAPRSVQVECADGQTRTLDEGYLRETITQAAAGLNDIDTALIFDETMKNVFDGMKAADIATAMIMPARQLIEQEPNYSYLAAKLLLSSLYKEVFNYTLKLQYDYDSDLTSIYPLYFKQFIKTSIDLGLLDSRLGEFNLEKLSQALILDRDSQFTYLSLQTLYDRYFLHIDNTRLELPQAFFMRVAMGLAINEVHREDRAIEFYQLLSSFDFMCSTPTLFNSGTLRPQLSSCYLTTVPDDLDGIFSAIKDDALLSKFAGGLGNDWSRVRALGSHIKGTNGASQGIVPFLKVANDTAVAVNQGGKRKGAMCAYLETWHLDIEDFLELRKNTGDDRRRTHDMHSANWIPDLFMKRVDAQGDWTLFSPDEVSDLHELTGKAFEKRYVEYEDLAARGGIKNYKTIDALVLWRKMLGMLFETGHPWITFKDPCNLRSPQQHVGTVHSSNLCTEITLNTNDEEVAVCNLGSVNLAQHITNGKLDTTKLQQTITTAMRILDNIIDYNYYSVGAARNANLKHRPVGLGLMGFQDALYQLEFSYASEQAVAFADQSMEIISYYAINASSDLAVERGKYLTFAGSLWSKGILPIDSIGLLKEERDGYLETDCSTTMDWDSLREKVKSQGMRNSNCLAIAPTATISNICGVTQSIEPTYQNLYVKSNLSGEFTIVNPYLVNELKRLKLWDGVMVNDLKYFDGNISPINRIPDDLKERYITAFELDPRWLVEAAARRQKWIDQSQSLNLYMDEPSGKKMDSLYKLAWVRGLKTTYYLRSKAASGVEKTITQKDISDEGLACLIDDPECEACQ